jgi:hypothetical protein
MDQINDYGKMGDRKRAAIQLNGMKMLEVCYIFLYDQSGNEAVASYNENLLSIQPLCVRQRDI